MARQHRALDLVSGYEGLRASIYPHTKTCGAGYALLVHRGLVAWMTAWSAYIPSREQNSLSVPSQELDFSAADQRDHLPKAPIPAMMQTEIVALLASMALECPLAEASL